MYYKNNALFNLVYPRIYVSIETSTAKTLVRNNVDYGFF